MKIVRATTSAQYSDILGLQLLTLPEDDLYQPDSGGWWVVYADGQPVAFAGVVPSRSWTDAMYLCRCGVAPSARGYGLQKRLLRVREQYARRLGMNWLVTDTTDNPPSANSLIGCGFRMFEPSTPWAGKRSLYWRKRIT